MINNEELKLIIYRLHDCVHKNPKISTENLLKLSEFHKIPRYKVNFKMIQFAIALKKKKQVSRNKSKKYQQNLYIKNKTLMTEIK